MSSPLSCDPMSHLQASLLSIPQQQRKRLDRIQACFLYRISATRSFTEFQLRDSSLPSPPTHRTSSTLGLARFQSRCSVCDWLTLLFSHQAGISEIMSLTDQLLLSKKPFSKLLAKAPSRNRNARGSLPLHLLLFPVFCP